MRTRKGTRMRRWRVEIYVCAGGEEKRATCQRPLYSGCTPWLVQYLKSASRSWSVSPNFKISCDSRKFGCELLDCTLREYGYSKPIPHPGD
jgi:hypothetical protein